MNSAELRKAAKGRRALIHASTGHLVQIVGDAFQLRNEARGCEA